jgi:hypothetical protein
MTFFNKLLEAGPASTTPTGNNGRISQMTDNAGKLALPENGRA